MPKTIRFGDLVRIAGRPQPVTLWVAPEKNHSFSKAVRENKVLTIHSVPGSHKKHFGQIGFHQGEGVIYLVFPKRLPKEPESRIVGINYQLADESEHEEPRLPKRPGSKKQQRSTTPPRPAEPEWKQFDVVVRRTATIEDTELVKAKNETEAREAALRAANSKPFELDRAILKVDILALTAMGVPRPTNTRK